ncbi:MAG: hypothetical protein BGN89_08185 [Alphaproteobacteria bacterium 64-6]|nr:MAG: hypothetical protein BGN89_08185 [Alphaproteobacteria bacterium 64-6]
MIDDGIQGFLVRGPAFDGTREAGELAVRTRAFGKNTARTLDLFQTAERHRILMNDCQNFL